MSSSSCALGGFCVDVECGGGLVLLPLAYVLITDRVVCVFVRSLGVDVFEKYGTPDYD